MVAARAISAPVAPMAEPMPIWARTSLRSTAEKGAPSAPARTAAASTASTTSVVRTTHTRTSARAAPRRLLTCSSTPEPRKIAAATPTLSSRRARLSSGRSPAGDGMRGDPDQHRHDDDGHHLERRVVRDVPGDSS